MTGDANFYAYVRNSPLQFVDPSGLDKSPSFLAAGFLCGPALVTLAVVDGPVPIGDAVGAALCVTAIGVGVGATLYTAASDPDLPIYLDELTQRAKRRLAKVLGGVPRSQQPTAQGEYGEGTRWWEFVDLSGKPKIVVEHPDETVHVGTPKPQSGHREGGIPRFYPEPGTGHVGQK